MNKAPFNQYIPNYKTNSYINKMYCIYCGKCANCSERNLCQRCGKTMFGKDTINTYTPKIPPKIDFTYTNSLYPSDYPYVYHYGSHKNKLINYC